MTKGLCLALCWMGLWAWAGDPASDSSSGSAEIKKVDFDIFWPLKSPSEAQAPGSRPLLKGCLVANLDQWADRGPVARLRVQLSRPSDEVARESWNSSLAFPEYDWMRYVRVWDAERKWLWPNLAYLLRLHGTERVERYGGVDPGKGVDNDFAAVLIRKFDSSGQAESEDTRKEPLVAAEWYPVDVTGGDKQTLVHKAQSDEFTLCLGRTEERTKGLAVIWLIYADLMGAKVPRGWPQELEYAGGILACFELKWDLGGRPSETIAVRQVVPQRPTAFDWERWTTRTLAAQNSRSTAKLCDWSGKGQNSALPPRGGAPGAGDKGQPVLLKTNRVPASSSGQRPGASVGPAARD